VSANDQSPIADTEVHYLRSGHVGDEFKIFVGHCGDAGAGTEAPGTEAPGTEAPAAVLYVGDANGLFAGAVEIVRFMQLSAQLPPILVVGIGYRLGGIAETVVVRMRDFTPTYDEQFVRWFPEQELMGGADNFLAFIRDELQPWVQDRYRVDADNSMFFGHSLGGLFANYVLLTEPQTFRRYGIGSPSLWWHDYMMFDHEVSYATTNDDLPAQAYFSVGAFEDHDGRQREVSRMSAAERAGAGLRYIDMVADTRRMAGALRQRKYPSLTIDSAVFPDEFHVTVAHLNLSRAVRFLFDATR
jgi:predicted alpha/beta superfamily hydrolase